MQITKPPHNRYALNCLDNATYVIWGVAKEVAQGSVVQYGKRRLATFVIGGATYICAPAVAVITNATRVVKSCKVVYTSVGYVKNKFTFLNFYSFN